MRPELEIISDWIEPGTRILDLGCGDGTLLAHLWRQRKVTGYGLEINDHNVVSCIEKGVTVIQSDLDAGLVNLFGVDSFDYVVMTQTLQAIRYPASLLEEMLQVGRQGIVTFPNIGHWRCRTNFVFNGAMPITRAMPNEWYETPNIHLCSVKDFEALCRKQDIHIIQRAAVDYEHQASVWTQLLPNLLCEIALYRFRRKGAS